MTKPTFWRRLSNVLIAISEYLLPHERAPWAEAMRQEVHHIDNDREALNWAIGCLFAGALERIKTMDVLRWRYARWLCVLLTIQQAANALFAPALTLAWRLDLAGATKFLGSNTPGDDYHRFIPLMEATPLWLQGAWVAAGLLFLAAAGALVRNRNTAFLYFVIALALSLFGSLALHLMPDLRQLSNQTFAFATPNIRRDYLIPAAQWTLPILIAAALWQRARQKASSAAL